MHITHDYDGYTLEMEVTMAMHPGKFLKQVYMQPDKLSATKLANAIGVNQSSVSRLMAGKSDMSIEMAIKLSEVYGTSAREWLLMQVDFNLEKHRDQHHK